MNDYLPAHIDLESVVAELNAAGWRDYKIEIVCGMRGGYIAKVRKRDIKQVSYQYGARLYNLWLDEIAHRQTVAETST